MTDWKIEGTQFVNCNCAYGCPCQFNALPTNENCEAVAALEVKRGNHGDVTLDGLRVVMILHWPGPVHEGRGKTQPIIDERADERQRRALLRIALGEDTDPGATGFNVYASTMEKTFEPIFAPIEYDVDVDGRRGRVRVPDLVEMHGEPIRNPITGEESRARIDLPNGFDYEIAEMGSASSTTRGNINLSLNDSYGQFTRVLMTNHGVVRTREVA